MYFAPYSILENKRIVIEYSQPCNPQSTRILERLASNDPSGVIGTGKARTARIVMNCSA